MKTLSILGMSLILSFSVMSQNEQEFEYAAYHHISDRDINSLHYVLTYINQSNIFNFSNHNRSVHIKLFKLPDYNTVFQFADGFYHGSFFYVIIDPYGGEAIHGHTQLFRTESFDSPELINVTESVDGEYFIVTIEATFSEKDTDLEYLFIKQGHLKSNPLNNKINFINPENYERKKVDIKFPMKEIR